MCDGVVRESKLSPTALSTCAKFSSLSVALTPAQHSPGQHPPAVQRVQGQTDTLHMGAKNH